MKDLIINREKDPLGTMMLDYLNGNLSASVEVDSIDFEMSEMLGELLFRQFAHMDPVEQLALSQCRGSVLDVGAGSGCHSLYLQENHIQVDAIDISPGSIEVLHKRGVRNCQHINLFSCTGKKYDTLLMLMNGMGICGNIKGLHQFFQFLPTILHQEGQLLTDSSDLRYLQDYEENISETEPFYQETTMVMRYGDKLSAPFDWIYLDFLTLQSVAEDHGFDCEKLHQDNFSGKYLARIVRASA